MGRFRLPAQDHVEYEIIKGNELDRFEMVNKRGVWSLHFRRRLKEPASFKLEIHGYTDYIDDEDDDQDDDTELDFNVHIRVVP